IHVAAPRPQGASSPMPGQTHMSGETASANNLIAHSEMKEQENDFIPVPVPKSVKPLSVLEQKKTGEEVPAEKTIRANRFELVDSKGKVRAVLAMTADDQPRLALADRSGQIQALISVEPFPGNPDGIPTMRLMDKTGIPRTDISLGGDGNPVITLRNKN